MISRREAIKKAALFSAVFGISPFFESRLRADFTIQGPDADAAFQQAFASGQKMIVIPKGSYTLTKTLRIPSGVTLQADPEAIITLADGAAKTADDYLLTNADHEAGNADITIEGGIWDGNNRNNRRPSGLFAAGYTGTMFHFQNVKGLTLKNLTLKNAEAYYTRYTHVDDFHIEDIRFDSNNIRPNNDGVHVGGNCSNGTIRNVHCLSPGVTGDDLVALNADDALTRTEVRGMTNGPIGPLQIDGLQAQGCHTFVRMLSVWSTIHDITIRNVRGTCVNAAINADAARGARVPVFDEKHPPFPDGVGLLENIDAADFQVAKSHAKGSPLLRLETRMKNFRLANFERMLSLDQAPEIPTLRIDHVHPAEILINGQNYPMTSGALTFSEPKIDTLSIQ